MGAYLCSGRESLVKCKIYTHNDDSPLRITRLNCQCIYWTLSQPGNWYTRNWDLKGTVSALTSGEVEHLPSSRADPGNGRRIKMIIGVSSQPIFNNNHLPQIEPHLLIYSSTLRIQVLPPKILQPAYSSRGLEGLDLSWYYLIRWITGTDSDARHPQVHCIDVRI